MAKKKEKKEKELTTFDLSEIVEPSPYDIPINIQLIGNDVGQSGMEVITSFSGRAGDFIVPQDMNIHAITITSDAITGGNGTSCQLNFGGVPLVLGEDEELSIGFSANAGWTIGVNQQSFSPEVIAKAWKFAEEIMGIEHVEKLKNGESILIKASNNITYELKPDGGIVNTNTGESYCLQLWFKDGYEKLPLPDILATKYIWITCLPEEVEKRANRFSIHGIFGILPGFSGDADTHG